MKESITRRSDYFSKGSEHVWVAFYQLHSMLGFGYLVSAINPCDDPLH